MLKKLNDALFLNRNVMYVHFLFLRFATSICVFRFHLKANKSFIGRKFRLLDFDRMSHLCIYARVLVNTVSHITDIKSIFC